MPPRTLDRLVYIDDSGDPRTGLAVYGWIEFAPDRWHDVLGGWLEHRKQLAARASGTAVKAALYAALLERFERELHDSDSLALVFMDGDGTDKTYRDAHRRLPRASHRIIEDPIYTDSKTSQLVQMADHVARCAFTAIAQAPGHEFAHRWYEQHLAVRDRYRRPQAL